MILLLVTKTLHLIDRETGEIVAEGVDNINAYLWLHDAMYSLSII